MRRSLLIRVILTAVVAGAAFPVATVVAGQLPPPPDVITGQLVDSACYRTLGAAATAPEHAKCAMMCAQKGQRVALVTSTGGVYAITGLLAQANNALLVPLLNRVVVLTGVISLIQAAAVPTPVPQPTAGTDARRPSGTGGVVEKIEIRKGDFREGDVPNGLELSIEAIAAKLVP